MKPGTIVRLQDGREGTVVYHGLDGYGIKWGRVAVDMDVILAPNPLFGKRPKDWPYDPDAMLREPVSPAVDARLWPRMECVGEDYEVVT